MTDPYELNYIPCSKVPAERVLAYLCFRLDNSKLILDTSWGELGIDLTPAFAGASGLLGTMQIGEYNSTIGIELDMGKNGYSFVPASGLNRILSMQYLHNVDTTAPIAGGDVYLFNGNGNSFHPYGLSATMQNLQNQLTSLQAQLMKLQALKKEVDTQLAQIVQRIKLLIARVEALENKAQ